MKKPSMLLLLVLVIPAIAVAQMTIHSVGKIETSLQKDTVTLGVVEGWPTGTAISIRLSDKYGVDTQTIFLSGADATNFFALVDEAKAKHEEFGE